MPLDCGEQTLFVMAVPAERRAEGGRHPGIVGREREQATVDVVEFELFQIERDVECLQERGLALREAAYDLLTDRLELRRVDGCFLALRGGKTRGIVEQSAVAELFVRQISPEWTERLLRPALGKARIDLGDGTLDAGAVADDFAELHADPPGSTPIPRAA